MKEMQEYKEYKEYKYYPDGIFIPFPVPYSRLLNQKKKCNTKLLLTYKKAWIKTIMYVNKEYTIEQCYTIIKSEGCELDDQLILDILKEFEKMKKLINETNMKKILYCTKVHHIFSKYEMELIRQNEGEEGVKKFKIKIKNGNNRRKHSKSCKEEVLSRITKDISKNELYTLLKGKVSRPTIIKILKENNIILKSKSKSDILIEKKLYNLFKYRIDERMYPLTYSKIAKKYNIKLKTFKRFISNSEKYRVKIKEFNELNKK